MLKTFALICVFVLSVNASYLVHIEVAARSGAVKKCGGALIHPSFVLTAASCFEEKEDARPRKVTIVIAYPDSRKAPISVRGNAIFLQPCYTDNGDCGNLAMIRLKESKKSSIAVHVARYATRPADDLWTAVGASAETYATANHTRLALDRVTVTSCSANASDCIICATAPTTCDLGSTDVGVPLVVKAGCYANSSQDAVVVGVSSVGSGCGKSQGVYTRVSLYSDWIRDIVSPGGTACDAQSCPAASCPACLNVPVSMEETIFGDQLKMTAIRVNRTSDKVDALYDILGVNNGTMKKIKRGKKGDPGTIGPVGSPGPPGLSVKGDKGGKGEPGDKGQKGMKGDIGVSSRQFENVTLKIEKLINQVDILENVLKSTRAELASCISSMEEQKSESTLMAVAVNELTQNLLDLGTFVSLSTLHEGDRIFKNTVGKCSPILPKHCSWYENLTTADTCIAFDEASPYRHCRFDANNNRESCVCCDFQHAAHYQFHSDIEALGYPSAECARFVSKYGGQVSRCNGNGIFYNNHCYCFHNYSGTNCVDGCKAVKTPLLCHRLEMWEKKAAGSNRGTDCHLIVSNTNNKSPVHNNVRSDFACNWVTQTNRCQCCMRWGAHNLRFHDFARILWTSEGGHKAKIYYDCPNQRPY